MTTAAQARPRFDRARLIPVADWLAVALAASLPWSTSATGILVALWLVAAVPTLTPDAVRREVATPAGGLPVLLWLVGAAGMLWADVSWGERLEGLSGFHKLLLIPLLLAFFRRGGRAREVMVAFVLSCTVLLAVSWLFLWMPELGHPHPRIGVPVKDYISQSAVFIVCMFVFAYRAIELWRAGRRPAASGLAALALVFLLNVLMVAVARTALVVIPVLLLALGFVCFRWKGVAALMAGLLVVVSIAWVSSDFLRMRVTSLHQEIMSYGVDGRRTSAGERLEFWRKSLISIAEAPVIGHGTGSIEDRFRRVASAEGVASSEGLGALVTNNPHNRTFAVAIQVGMLGSIVLWAMWAAHGLLVYGRGLVAWTGIVIVTQNVIGGLFNTHLFDFTHGWLYVFGLGIAGGTLLRLRGPAERPAGEGAGSSAMRPAQPL